MSHASTTKCIPGQLTLLGFVEYVPTGEDDTFRRVERPPVQMASITLAAKASGYSRATIYRLFKAGFIQGDHSCPGKILISMQSLQALRESGRDADGYWTKARRKQFQRK